MLSQPFFVPAGLILLLAIPLILERIPPNPIYGVRTSETMANARLWYQTNRYGGWTFLGSSLIYLGVAWMLPTSGANDPDFGRWLIHLGAFVGPLIISLLLIRNYIKTRRT